MKRRIHPFMLAVGILSGCTDRGVRIHWKDGDYLVYTRPASNEIILGYYKGDGAILGLSDPTVIAAGSDSRYVTFKMDSDSTPLEYYYIRKRPRAEGEISGPLTEGEYLKIAKTLSLPKFSWSLSR
ncbi:MAG TPA: hypothetical protein VFG14_08890 [Chthoniobacteraceae bacterium]|nr:hypothetical protein [Chthoniobacteraceae bacterium]